MPDPYGKPWRRLWRHETLAVAYDAAGKHNGLAFTLNLSPAREQALMACNDPADMLRRYISREMRAAHDVVLPFGFIFEIAPDTGKLHAHGVVVPHDGSETYRHALKEVLARAGGKIKGRGAARQVDLKPITDGLGWAVYSQKQYDEVCRYLRSNKVTYISSRLNQLSTELHGLIFSKDK